MSCDQGSQGEQDVWQWTGALWGTACSGGIAIGLVHRVGYTSEAFVHADWRSEPRVLVTKAADSRALEMAPFPPIGVVAELGGIGSNLAIRLRELGIPAAMGVGGACRRLQDGMTVLVDGNKGLVLILSDPPPIFSQRDEGILVHQ